MEKFNETIIVNYHGLELEVSGFFDEGEKGDYETPSSPPTFQSHSIFILVAVGNINVMQKLDSVDIHGILSSSAIIEIESLCVNEMIDA